MHEVLGSMEGKEKGKGREEKIKGLGRAWLKW
jgi:hypothetical protein